MSTADRLALVVRQLERGERAFAFMASVLGMPFDDVDKNIESVAFLVALAAYFETYPDADNELCGLVDFVESLRP